MHRWRFISPLVYASQPLSNHPINGLRMCGTILIFTYQDMQASPRPKWSLFKCLSTSRALFHPPSLAPVGHSLQWNLPTSSLRSNIRYTCADPPPYCSRASSLVILRIRAFSDIPREKITGSRAIAFSSPPSARQRSVVAGISEEYAAGGRGFLR